MTAKDPKAPVPLRDGDEPWLGALSKAVSPGTATPAPPSAALWAAVSTSMGPVRTRRRFGAFFCILGVGLIWPAIRMLIKPWRSDLSALPSSWVIVGATFWAAASLGSLAWAVIPRRGQVLPAVGPASRLAAVSLLSLTLFVGLGTITAPGASQTSASEGLSVFASCAACGSSALVAAAVFLITGGLLFRRWLPIGGARLGFALGTAGGAAGGLASHFLCPITETAHVVLGHVGAVALSAAVGAWLLPRLLSAHARD